MWRTIYPVLSGPAHACLLFVCYPMKNPPNLLSRCIPHARNRKWVKASSVLSTWARGLILTTGNITVTAKLHYNRALHVSPWPRLWGLLVQGDTKHSYHWLCTVITKAREFNLGLLNSWTCNVMKHRVLRPDASHLTKQPISTTLLSNYAQIVKKSSTLSWITDYTLLNDSYSMLFFHQQYSCWTAVKQSGC